MKKAIILFSFLLLFWIAGSSYVYVCKIQKDCGGGKSIENASLKVGETGNARIDELQTASDAPEILKPEKYIIYFDSNKSSCVITTKSYSHFELIKGYLSANAGKKVSVTGHSDAIGSEISKKFISAKRAEFIKDKMVEAGVPADAIETIAESDHIQAADNSTTEGRTMNRRTEILIK